MQIKTILISQMIFFALSFGLRAEIDQQIDPIGFSKDGRYVAYFLFRTDRKNGKEHGIFRLIDVRNNSFVGKKITVTTDLRKGGAGSARSQVMRRALGPLAKYRIVDGNLGVRTFRFQPKMSDDWASARTVTFRARNGKGMEKDYTIQIIEFPAGDRCDPVGYRPHGYSISLLQNRTSLVFEGVKRPQHCIAGYGIHSIYVYRGYALVIYDGHRFGPGWKGAQKMAATVELF